MYEIDDDNQLFGRALVAAQDIARESVILSLRTCEVLHAPTRYSVYVGGDRHVDHPTLARLNHSCAPNVFVDTAAQEVVALRAIAAGEVLSFFYPATEWAMSYPFECACGAEPCIGLVEGAAFASEPVLARHRLNEHITELLERKRAAAGSVA